MIELLLPPTIIILCGLIVLILNNQKKKIITLDKLMMCPMSGKIIRVSECKKDTILNQTIQDGMIKIEILGYKHLLNRVVSPILPNVSKIMLTKFVDNSGCDEVVLEGNPVKLESIILSDFDKVIQSTKTMIYRYYNGIIILYTLLDDESDPRMLKSIQELDLITERCELMAPNSNTLITIYLPKKYRDILNTEFIKSGNKISHNDVILN